MAEITFNTVIKEVEKVVLEKVSTKVYTLTLSQEELSALRGIIGYTGGSTNSRRKLLDNIFSKIEKFTDSATDLSGNLTFLDIIKK